MRLNQFIHNISVILQLISAQNANTQVNLNYTLVRMCKSPVMNMLFSLQHDDLDTEKLKEFTIL